MAQKIREEGEIGSESREKGDLPPCSPPLITTSQITLHIICINFQVAFFENNFREFGTPYAVCE